MATLRRPPAIRTADTARDFRGIVALYRELGWSHASDPARLRTAVERSAFSIVAVDEDDAVIGFARALSDDAFAVYIADVLVLPSHQRQGIGRALVETILERYPLERYHHQVLVAERGAEGFYRRLGLVPVSAYGLTGFIRARR
jgi:predicted N-acetyltransferase YhbS